MPIDKTTTDFRLSQPTSVLESSDSETSRRKERQKREHEKKVMRDKEKIEKMQEAFCDIELSETETFFLLVMYFLIINFI